MGTWFGGFLISYWLATFTLVPVSVLLWLFVSVVVLTLAIRASRGPSPGSVAGSFVLGIAVYAPLVVTGVLLLNLVPTSMPARTQH